MFVEHYKTIQQLKILMESLWLKPRGTTVWKILVVKGNLSYKAYMSAKGDYIYGFLIHKSKKSVYLRDLSRMKAWLLLVIQLMVSALVENLLFRSGDDASSILLKSLISKNKLHHYFFDRF